MKPLLIISILVVFLSTSCTTKNLDRHQSRRPEEAQDIRAKNVSVIFEKNTEKYSNFIEKLKAEMKSWYLDESENSNYSTIKVEVDEIHFIHKTASFFTGGAAGGNWIKLRLIVVQDGKEKEYPIEKKFNTGGGATIFQDWELKMIYYVVTEIDRILISETSNK